MSEVDRLRIVDGTLIVLSQAPAVSGAFSNLDGSITAWTRPAEMRVLPALLDAGAGEHFLSHLEAAVWLAACGLTATEVLS